MHTYRCTRLFAQRLQRLSPSPATKHLCQHTEWERQEHPCPRHLVQEHFSHSPEVETTVHPVEYSAAQYKRCQHIQSVFAMFFHRIGKITNK